MTGKDLFIGMSYIDRKFIDEAENGALPRHGLTVLKANDKTGKRSRILMIAAIVAMMLFLVGCTAAAVVLLGLDNLQIISETYTQNAHYNQDGSKVPAAEKVTDIISMVGMEGSINYQAMQEWLDFLEEYDPDGTLQNSAVDYQKPMLYDDYSVYSQEMADKIEDICREYGLKVTGRAEIMQSFDEPLFAEVLGINSVFREKANVLAEFGGARFNECGNFNVSYNVTMAEYSFMLSYNYHNKDYFGVNRFIIEDSDGAEQWNYTRKDGTAVLIVSEKGGDAHILCDREDAFLSVTFKNVGENWDNPSDVMSRQDMEQLAETLDFTLITKPVENMDQVAEKLEESREEYENRDWSEQEELHRQEYEENECHGSYTELIACMRDNEAYFTSKKNAGYENFWETMEYVLRDVTGDGEEELILGKNGSIYAIWTMRDGVTDHLEGGYPEGYLCEGNVFEHYSFLDGQPFHFYRQLTNEGRSTKILDVEYQRATGTWILDESTDGSDWEEISEEKAKEIIGRYPRIQLDLKPISEFPMN